MKFRGKGYDIVYKSVVVDAPNKAEAEDMAVRVWRGQVYEITEVVEVKQMSRFVVIESPFSAPDVEGVTRNRDYLCACVRHARLDCGEVVWASHGFYPHFMHDAEPSERASGIQANLDMIAALHAGAYQLGHEFVVAVYEDLGVSGGMQLAIDRAQQLGIDVVRRKLGPDWPSRVPADLHHANQIA